ncbi:MAG: hypothetical protein WCO23_00590 [bacterium]
MKNSLSRPIKWLFVGFIVLISLCLLGLAYWYLPIKTYTYESSGQKIFSIRYPLRFNGAINQSGDSSLGSFLDIGTAEQLDMSIDLIHFVYSSANATFNTKANGDGEELSYSKINNCADLEKYDTYHDTYGSSYINGYKSRQIDGRTLCYLNNDQALDATNTRGDLILNPKPEGKLSVLYPKNESFQVNLMLNSIKIYK